MSETPNPLPMGSIGRRADGTFGPGHPFSRTRRRTRAQKLRRAYQRAVSPDDLAAVAKAMLAAALNGDTGAARELTDRLIGKAIAQDLEDRISALESAIAERGKQAGREVA